MSTPVGPWVEAAAAHAWAGLLVLVAVSLGLRAPYTLRTPSGAG